MSDGRWRISVTAPDWGQDHLSPEAVVAFVDDELAHGPFLRASQHLAQCAECSAHVVAQGQARAALRTAEGPSLPSSLLSSLRSIPQNTDLPGPPAGLAVTCDGQFVSVLRPERDADPAPGRRPGHRRIRIGTGVAVSGLAIGAMAFGLPAASSGTGVPVPAGPDRGVLGGSGFGGGPPGALDAQLRIAPVATPTQRPDPRGDGDPGR